MIKIKILPNNIEERKYIIDVILLEFLGLEYDIQFTERAQNYEIYLENGNCLIIGDYFFKFFKNPLEYLNLKNIPQLIRYQSKKDNPFIFEEDIPIIYGENKPLQINENGRKKNINCSIDIFASSYFMLSRWEEYVNHTRDTHNRFPAYASLAYKFGFLDRPVVNEYVEMLKNMLRYLDPSLKYKKYEYKIFVTCDVDLAFEPALHHVLWFARRFVGDLLKRRDFKKSLRTVRNFITGIDEYYQNIFYIIDINEKLNNKVAFYFIPHITNPKYDPPMDLDSDGIRNLIEIICKRGCEVGIHPGYDTYNNEANFKKSAEKFFSVLSNLKVDQQKYGGRQHFLRWDSSITPLLWDKAGFYCDSTLSYADRAGFRCGVCWEFPIYDYLNRRRLKIKERPLIAMDVSIIGKQYEGLGYTEKALTRFLFLKQICKKYSGIFTLLWHNTFFENNSAYKIYEEVLST